jgi:hypothetical protein
MTVDTLVATTNRFSIHIGTAVSPARNSDAKPTNASPNSHSTTISTSSATAATTSRSTSAGDRTARSTPVRSAESPLMTLHGATTHPRPGGT